MPRTSLHASRTRKATRKTMSIVIAAIASSALGRYQGFVAVGSGTPNVDLPSALRITVSKCSRAAVVAGVADSTDSSVAVDGIGGETCVARNIWYVCTELRMNRHDSGMTGRPRRLTKF